MKRERILSADSHAAIRDDAVLAHLESRYHEDYRRARQEALARMAKRAKKKRAEAGGAGALAKEQAWSAAGRAGEWDPVERLKDMDVDGVEAEVLYCDVQCGVDFYGLADGGRVAAFRAFNDAALDFARPDPKRLLPVYVVPLVDVDEAVREVERLAKSGARAIMLPLYPTDVGLAPYHDERYERLWSVIAETRIPVSQHVNVNEHQWRIFESDPTPARGIFQALPPIFMAEAIAGWIVPGILARHPGLKIVLVEAGLGWIPYFLQRLDTMKERHGWDHYKMLPERPSFYWRRQMAATFEEDELGIELRDRIGVENLMWATDYPHPDSTWPESQKVLETHFHDVPADEARKMIGGNAARFYGL